MHKKIPSTYQEALDYLYSFIDYERKPPATPQEARHNLQRTSALLAAVGQPQQQFASVVVAGTKGKGSTTALLESMLRAAGYRTGMWTSPHLNSYRERIQVNCQLIDQAALVDAMQRLVPVVEAFDVDRYGQPTVFELGFALALRFFAEQQAQVAVLEVGLGGRYDCANTVTPLVSLVGSISYDHTQVLGTTLASIAFNKAGIFRPGVPAFTVPQQPEALAVLQQEAATLGTPLHMVAEQGIAGEPPATPHPYPVQPVSALRGAFQQENTRLALAGALALRDQGFGLPDEALRRGLDSVTWPGRLEVAARQPLVVLDGAHNGDSARKLAAALREEFQFERLLLVIGMSHDKPLDAILSALVPAASTLILTRSRHPRAYTDLDELAAIARPYLRGDLVLTGDIPEALDAARQRATPADLICVTGSLYVVGAAREALGLATVCD